MSYESRNILLVLYLPKGTQVGGHLLSAKELAISYLKNGDFVTILINSRSFIFDDIASEINIIYEKNRGKYLSFISRYFLIKRIIKSEAVDYIVPFDKYSTNHCSLICSHIGIPMIPIMPGGDPALFRIRPLNLSNYIVFSKETKDYLVGKYGFKDSNIHLILGRFSFKNRFIPKKRYTSNSKLNLVYITGLREEKFEAFKYFLHEIREHVKDDISVSIFGTGNDEHIFRKEVSDQCLDDLVDFAGFQSISYESLLKFDLAISMGRGVIECIDLQLPVAICGSQGYKGLVVMDNFDIFLQSNFTGRGVNKFSDLVSDIIQIKSGVLNSIELNNYVKDNFDVVKLRSKIDEISRFPDSVPFNSNVFHCLLENIYLTINR